MTAQIFGGTQCHTNESLIIQAAMNDPEYQVSAHDITYEGITCSACGERKRNTRVAASIFNLKQRGFGFETSVTPDKQAIYTMTHFGHTT